eukprot:TRINITY_DN73572_c0_g1_i1.p1 TRINITY_DN73572_c0_g1~~TRINITY_DN73572_c0_g1_i1.p1  ORF type:complete len:459 (+),score=56.93 TRINITY_DN73572_c0_g1_i1:180-1379(+)
MTAGDSQNSGGSVAVDALNHDDSAVIAIRSFLNAFPTWPAPLLDLRSVSDVQQQRLPNCTHIPWDQLPWRCFELPPRETPLALLIKTGSGIGRAIREHVEERERKSKRAKGVDNVCGDEIGHDDVGASVRPTVAELTVFFKDCKRPWDLQHVLVDSPTLWVEVSKRGLLRSGPPPRPFLAAGVCVNGGLTIDTRSVSEPTDCSIEEKQPVLWRPGPLIQAWLPTILRSVVGRTALDVGCGSGRDTIFLGMHGWRTIGTDNMEGALARVAEFAVNMGVEDRVHTRLVDLKDAVASTAMLADLAPLSLVLVTRFLHKPLLPVLADAIGPCGFIVYEHFDEGALRHPMGRPSKPQDVLMPGELRAVFGGIGWEVLLEDNTPTLADGRPMVHFVARRCPPVEA